MAARCAKTAIVLLSAGSAVTAVLIGWHCPPQKLHAFLACAVPLAGCEVRLPCPALHARTLPEQAECAMPAGSRVSTLTRACQEGAHWGRRTATPCTALGKRQQRCCRRGSRPHCLRARGRRAHSRCLGCP